MQYPTAKLSSLKNLFAVEPHNEFTKYSQSLYFDFLNEPQISPEFASVIFVGLEEFNLLIEKDGYETYFSDRFSVFIGGKFGHATRTGHQLIADFLSKTISERWQELGSTWAN